MLLNNFLKKNLKLIGDIFYFIYQYNASYIIANIIQSYYD